ncbi:MAG: hypothetical protein ACW99G_01685 [Candidatus Thorarchaeota archaeon]|jgi:hypothetical protein
MPELLLNNLRLGQRADGGNRRDALQGLRRLVNYDLEYGGETVDMVVRKGYERFNAVALPDIPQQVRVFVDQRERQKILSIVDGKWYDVDETGSHNQISSFDATAPKPYMQWGNRAILGTDADDADDPGFVWTSNDELATSPRSYRLGISRPEEPAGANAHDKEGNWQDTPTHIAVMNKTDQTKIAIKYQPSLTANLRDIYIAVRRFEGAVTAAGSWQLKIYTDNGNQPSTTMVDENAVSQWIPVNTFVYGNWSTRKLFKLRDAVQLEAGTWYWLVLEANSAYYDNFKRSGATDDFYGAVGIEGVAPNQTYGPSLAWNVVGWTAFTREAVFYIGGMDSVDAEDGVAYEYVYTYYNEEYQSESRPSEPTRIKPSAFQGIYLNGFVASTDPQVDKIRVYRRELDYLDVPEESVTDTYKFVAELDPGGDLTDATATAYLGAELQTEDHYPLDDYSPEEEEGHRTEPIIPFCACMWKGRIWVGQETNNRLAFSKVFEENGRTGMLGLSSIGYFPLDNIMDIPEPAHPIALYPVSNDQLVVHMSNDTAYVIYGGDQALNPPADFSIRPYLHSNSSFGTWCGALWSTYHVFLSKAGLYMVSGFGSFRPEYLSEENQSILNTVSSDNLSSSKILGVGNEIWTLIDFDNDGVLDTILILDMQRDVVTQQDRDRPWKMYQYDVGLTDIDVISSGDDFQQVYAADAESEYILELRKGDTDNGTGITSWWETHDLVYPSQAMIYQIDIDAWYPSTSFIPDYDWTLTSGQEETVTGSMTGIQSSEDIPGHRMGTQLKRGTSVRALVSQVAYQQNKVRGFVISHTGE